MNENHEEYLVLTEKLEEVIWALEGSCNDIDCDKYIYKKILKKKFKPILEHNSSCIPKLKREKEALMNLLSLQKFKKFRYKECAVCKRKFDSLGNNFTIVSFTRPVKSKGEKLYEYDSVYAHKQCKRKVVVPVGWHKGF